MKKILLLFTILIILGGVAFFLGWAQLTVPLGTYGVLRSKTHGIDPQVIREGKFQWVWYKLIPTNVVIQTFTLDRISRSLLARDALPSGSEYASFAGLRLNFSYEVSAVFSCTIKPDSLTSLVVTYNISNQTDLNAFEADLADQIEAFALQRLRLYMGDEEKITEILSSGRLIQWEDDIQQAFPDIENLSCNIHTPHFPDIQLYHTVRSIYEDYVAKQREYIQTDRLLQPEARIGSQIRFEELAKYGELLTKYPILLQYLTIEKGR
ncbi:MAG: hypothetical protein LBU17_07690 [Treponema sp.]|jgi:hypothetical protein|nr:hypothetical protein [Treponema sp.]